MTIKDTFRKTLLGLDILQEYVCLQHESLDNPFNLFVTGRGQNVVLNVTAHHLFLGYKPVVIALGLKSGTGDCEWLRQQKEICITFQGLSEVKADSTWKGFAIPGSAVAKMVLEKTSSTLLGNTEVYFYTGTWGEHTFLSGLHQFINLAKKKLSFPKKANITLDINLADQVRIAYAVPRIISLITVTDGVNMNMFPTDLHGPIGHAHYLSSLRHGGKASDQVMKSKRIALSDVRSDWYRKVYDLGKNHMRDLAGAQHFALARQVSERFHIPLPEAVLGYRELIVSDYFDMGIHRIISYDLACERTVAAGNRLSHIHQYAAQWRQNQHLHNPMLMR